MRMWVCFYYKYLLRTNMQVAQYYCIINMGTMFGYTGIHTEFKIMEVVVKSVSYTNRQ